MNIYLIIAGYAMFAGALFRVFSLRRRTHRLSDLIEHAWIHTGYVDCGYRQMTTEQKKLYCEILKLDFSERQESLERIGR